MILILRSSLYYDFCKEDFESIKKAYFDKIHLYFDTQIKEYQENEAKYYVLRVYINYLSDLLTIARMIEKDLIIRTEHCEANLLFMDIYDNYIE